MFTACPRCGRNVAFDGDNTVDLPTCSIHTCVVENGRGRLRVNRGAPYSPSGQQRECMCGQFIYQAADGSKFEPDGAAHYCCEYLLAGG